jgi:uncharacterized membrane protein YpjA
VPPGDSPLAVKCIIIIIIIIDVNLSNVTSHSFLFARLVQNGVWGIKMFTIIVLTSSSNAVELGERVLTSIRLTQFFASQWVEQWSDHTATHGSGVSFPNL